ncbi:MAG: hypothetical protein VX464_20890 [Pseudomonadota bacterium]|nr:hypothetical protein [Pseudomonadota bacterium]
MEQRDKLILEILALAYAVDRLTDFCVFIDYFGHVGSIDIEIAESKTRWQRKIATTEFYTDGRYQEDKDAPGMGWLAAKRDHLKQILDDHDIDVSEMTEHVEQTVQHWF